MRKKKKFNSNNYVKNSDWEWGLVKQHVFDTCNCVARYRNKKRRKRKIENKQTKTKTEKKKKKKKEEMGRVKEVKTYSEWQTELSTTKLVRPYSAKKQNKK